MMMFMQIFFLIFFIKACCGYSIELPRLVKAIQMSIHNICFHNAIATDRALFSSEKC